MRIDAWPITTCTRFGVHPRCAMNRLAAAWRSVCIPYLGSVLPIAPDRGNRTGELQGPKNRPEMFCKPSMLPRVLGNTNPSSPLGQSACHSRNAFTTMGASGISRAPALDFGGPIRRQASARCRTWMSPSSRSTFAHARPRSSLARIPVKIAVTMKGRQRPVEFSIIALSSALEGKSTPSRNGPMARHRGVHQWSSSSDCPRAVTSDRHDSSGVPGRRS
jgi:hypothetical protein